MSLEKTKNPKVSHSKKLKVSNFDQKVLNLAISNIFNMAKKFLTHFCELGKVHKHFILGKKIRYSR